MRRPHPILALLLVPTLALSQDRLPTMPGYAVYHDLEQKRGDAYEYGRLDVNWAADGRSFQAQRMGELQEFSLASRTWTKAKSRRGEGGLARSEPARGRQFDVVYAPDGKTMAICRNRNVYLKTPDGKERPLTVEGSAASRVKFGTASWVYGEELEQREAMWFSPDGTKLAYYRFDEKNVPDYFLALDQTAIQDRLDVEAYPVAGAPNPIADVFVVDLPTGRTVRLDSRFGDAEIGHYVYNIRWSPDGSEVLYFRMNRLQNRMQFCAADPVTGAGRVVLEESNPNGWVPYLPGSMWFRGGQVPLYLADSGKADRRFIWVSERNGYRNAYLYDLSGRLLNAITQNPFDLHALLGVDPHGRLWYSAHDGKYPAMQEVHRVSLDGLGDTCVTDPSLNHEVAVSPTGDHFVDVAEALDKLPSTRLCDASGAIVSTLAASNDRRAQELGLTPVERVEFTAADGETKLYGWLSKPAHFDPAKRYPLLVSVYGGPESGGEEETFVEPSDIADLGFIVVWFDGRGSFGRGRAFRTTGYRKLGQFEIDDQAAGVRELAKRRYVDASRVGIYGVSYGGYASLMALLRYPQIFKAASASSPVSDWRNYDSIYTERYMGLPKDNAGGYNAGAVTTYLKDMSGALQLFYGTADNNCHPSNTIQILNELARLGKSCDLVVGPDQEHSAVDQSRMMEFFIDHLVLGR